MIWKWKSHWAVSGGAEFGPRALGNRSIIINPQSENMQKNLIWWNLKASDFYILLSDDLSEWFKLNEKIHICC